MNQHTAPKKYVREIEADPRFSSKLHTRLRIAAYCRVSTEQEEQERSEEHTSELQSRI